MKRLYILASLLVLLVLSATAASAGSQPPMTPTHRAPRAPQANMVQIALGEWRGCSITAEGTVLCWGANGSGQIGDGTTSVARPSPVYVQGLTGVTAIAAGGEHTCAVTNGRVQCWGSNLLGQLGNNSTTSSSTPVDVQSSTSDSTPLSGVTGIAAGVFHTCALLTTGAVKCWGNNANGQLGDGTTTRSLAPTDVQMSSTDPTPLSGMSAITAGSAHTCALMSNGGVKCWGNNANGQLGDGTTIQRKTPVDVHAGSGDSIPLADATAVDAGDNFTCAVMTGGTAKCWGQGGNGQLGNNSTSNIVTAPVDVQTSSTDSNPLSGVTAIASGGYLACALMSTGGVKCWGHNQYGDLGDGTTINPRRTPVDVSGLDDVLAVDTGHFNSCALMTTGEVQCWGYNAHGELGIGVTDLVPHSSPERVALPLATTTAVISSANPAVVGQTIVLTATVSTADQSKTPTGNVTFWDGATSLGTHVLNASAQITQTVIASGVGTHSITAAYAGATGFDPSTSPVFSQAIAKASTLTTLGAPPNTRWPGSSVVFTATVTVAAPGAGLPAGSVTFKDGTNTIAGCGTRALSAGAASCTSGALSSGSHAITASYSGDESFTPSASAVLDFNIFRLYLPLTIK